MSIYYQAILLCYTVYFFRYIWQMCGYCISTRLYFLDKLQKELFYNWRLIILSCIKLIESESRMKYQSHDTTYQLHVFVT